MELEVLTTADLNSLIAAYGAYLGAGPLPLGESDKLDVDAAIGAHLDAETALVGPASKDGWRRTMIRTAILLARPVKA